MDNIRNNDQKTALILGVSGQDGSYLAKFLLAKGYRVVGASRDAQMSSFANLKRLEIYDRVELESVSLNDFRSVLQVFKKVHSQAKFTILPGRLRWGSLLISPLSHLKASASAH